MDAQSVVAGYGDLVDQMLKIEDPEFKAKMEEAVIGFAILRAEVPLIRTIVDFGMAAAQTGDSALLMVFGQIFADAVTLIAEMEGEPSLLPPVILMVAFMMLCRKLSPKKEMPVE